MKTRLLALASIPLSLAAIAGATSLLGTQGATPFADEPSPSTSGVWHHYQAQETYIDMKGTSIRNTKEYYVECGSGVHQFEAPVSPKQLIEEKETKHPDVSEFAVNDDRYGDILCTAGIKYTEFYQASAKTICSGDQVVAAYNHGERVTHIGDFAGKSLTSLLLPSTVTHIADNAFYECLNLASFVIPSTVTSVGVSALFGCTSLAEFTFNAAVDYIPGSVCYKCSNLKTVYIDSSITSIGEYAFADTILTDIYYSGSEASWESITKHSHSTWCGGLTPTIHFNYVA